MRVTAEIANQKSEEISTDHVDAAISILQKDRLQNVVGLASFHFKVVCLALARITYLGQSDWNSTFTVYEQYKKILPKDTKPLSYRRISEILVEIQNTGIVTSETGSRGRHGYGTSYKLLVSPRVLGQTCFSTAWDEIEKNKTQFEYSKQLSNISFGRKNSSYRNILDNLRNTRWYDYVGKK